MKKLLIIIPDSLNSLISKGEVIERYYNPGNFFEEVHIVVLKKESVDIVIAQQLVGNAKLYLHFLKLPKYYYYWTFGLNLKLLRIAISKIVNKIIAIQPDLIRCYGNSINSFIAAIVKQELSIPYVLSLHGNPDVDYYRGRLGNTWAKKIYGKLIEKVELFGLKAADWIIPVYSPILPYLNKHNLNNYEIIYNVVGIGSPKKNDYSVDHSNINLICVGRQNADEKNPLEIIRAVSRLINCNLLLIGDGDLHDFLVSETINLNSSNRITFIKSLPNYLVLEKILKSDIFIYSSDNYEVSKATMEAALMGLPIILNNRYGNPASELLNSPMILVDNNCKSYEKAIKSLISNRNYRECLGKSIYSYAHSLWDPAISENKLVSIYERLTR